MTRTNTYSVSKARNEANQNQKVVATMDAGIVIEVNQKLVPRKQPQMTRANRAQVAVKLVT
jgi:hypothetical protein